MLRFTPLLALCILAGCTPSETPEGSPPVKLVEVASVRMQTPSHRFLLTATTRASERAEIASQVGGTLESRPIKLGDHVEAGALLARLGNPEAEPALKAAQARLHELRLQQAQAQRDVQRIRELFDKKLVTRQALEQAQTHDDALAAAAANAQANADAARRRLAETTLHAPFAGEIVRLDVEPGEFVPAGRPLLAMAGQGVEAAFELPETLLAQVSPGQAVTLSLPLFGDRAVTGHVVELAQSAVAPSPLFPVVIALNDAAELRPGLTLEWPLQQQGSPQLMVPLQAIVSPAGAPPRVYRVVQNRAQAVPVVPGEIEAAEVAVSGALQAGDKVIVAGLNSLVDGYPVEIQR